MYVAIRRPRVHRAVCACAYRNSVKIVNVDRMLTLIVAHQSRTEQQHEQPASYSRERDLENSILKGRISRLKQYTKLLWS